MDEHLYYQADIRRLNKKAKIGTPEGKGNRTDKLIDRLFPHNDKAPPVHEDLPFYKLLAGTLSSIKEKINWEQNLLEGSYAVFDTETTGLHPFKGDEIISIGALQVEKGEIADRPPFEMLVNPLRPIPPQISKLTGITAETVQDQPTICSALMEFLKYIGPRILVAHNAPFDLAFINIKLGEAIGTRMVNPVIDTVMLASALYPNLGDYSLENLAPRFKIDLCNRHSAAGDARITAELFLCLLPDLIEQGITTLPQLAGLLCESDDQTCFPLIF